MESLLVSSEDAGNCAGDRCAPDPLWEIKIPLLESQPDKLYVVGYISACTFFNVFWRKPTLANIDYEQIYLYFFFVHKLNPNQLHPHEK